MLPADRNIIYTFSPSNFAGGIIGGSTSGLNIYGNYIGIGRDGVTDLTPTEVVSTGLEGPYAIHINLVNGSGATVGGTSTGQANLISGGTAQVVLSSDNHKVQGNLIGTDYTGQVNENITNGVGVTVTAGSHNLVGGTSPGEGNIIAGLSGGGVLASAFVIQDIDGNGNSFNIVPQSLSILGNSIYDIRVFNFTSRAESFGNMNQGIDHVEMIDESSPGDFIPDNVNDRGPTPNDAGDIDQGPNASLTFLF